MKKFIFVFALVGLVLASCSNPSDSVSDWSAPVVTTTINNGSGENNTKGGNNSSEEQNNGGNENTNATNTSNGEENTNTSSEENNNEELSNVPANNFVTVNTTSANIASVIRNATQNTRIVFSEIYLPTDASTALNENSSVKFIFDLSKTNGDAIHPKHHFNIENTNVVEIVFPSGIKTLGLGTFQNYKGITEITIPETVESIGMCSFGNCVSLKKVSILNKNVSVSPTGVFSGCPNITEFTTPNVVMLNQMDSDNLEVLDIIGTPKVFGGLKGNKKITSITLPEGVEEIEDYGLAGEALETVSLPSTIKKIGKYAFGDNVKYLTCNQLDGWWYNSYFYAGYNRNYNSTGATNLLFNLFKHEDYRTEPCYKVSGRNEIPTTK
jgi:hypothetical protein